MKAVKVVDKKLIITKTNKPVPRDNEILIKIKAAVEKFAGNININTKPTGSHNSNKLCLKTIDLSLNLAR